MDIHKKNYKSTLCGSGDGGITSIDTSVTCQECIGIKKARKDKWHKAHYGITDQKPEVVERQCLKCDDKFWAPNKYIRVCCLNKHLVSEGEFNWNERE